MGEPRRNTIAPTRFSGTTLRFVTPENFEVHIRGEKRQQDSPPLYKKKCALIGKRSDDPHILLDVTTLAALFRSARPWKQQKNKFRTVWH